jgi:hypothetical protein
MPWRNFAHNRSSALLRLREQSDIDYGLMIDADEIVVYEPGLDVKAFKKNLRCDLYDVKSSLGDIVYLRPQLISNRVDFFYKGVLHEYLQCPAGCGFHATSVKIPSVPFMFGDEPRSSCRAFTFQRLATGWYAPS